MASASAAATPTWCRSSPGSQLKLGCHAIGTDNLRQLTELSRFVDELANLQPSKHQAYVGQSAFAHKGGVHVAAVRKNPRDLRAHRSSRVGNTQRVLISDLAGTANILEKAEEFGVTVDRRTRRSRRCSPS